MINKSFAPDKCKQIQYRNWIKYIKVTIILGEGEGSKCPGPPYRDESSGSYLTDLH